MIGDPLAGRAPDLNESCEHCLTVTWAGVPACGCRFGERAVDEETTELLRIDALTTPPVPPRT